MSADHHRRSLVTAGTLLGIGLGGFVDGIVFHQILQVHHMLTARYPTLGVDPQTALVNTQINMFWDGLFHAFTWTTTALGLYLLWRAVKRGAHAHPGRLLLGAMALGWGLFNLVEGVIDHHLLRIHYVTETHDHLTWDLLFLASGVVLLLIGMWLIRTGRGTFRPA